MLDLTRSATTQKVWLEVTTRCNLRCTYCHLSHEDIPEVDLDLAHYDRFIENLKSRGAEELIFNGRGENSFLDGWHKLVDKAIDAGLKVTAVSNLSRSYSDQELQVFSRFSSLTVSVDTTDAAIFRAIRRKADIKLVISNILRIQAIAIEDGRLPPYFAWNMIVHTDSIFNLARSVSEGVAANVDHFHLSVLGETPELPGALCPRQLDHLSVEDFIGGLDQIGRAKDVAEANKRRITMAFALDGLIDDLCRKHRIAARPRIHLDG
jgi:Radical SAM superfamily